MAVTIAVDQLAAELKTRRARLDLSLREVETQTGISAATLSRIERGSLPEVGVIEKLAKWLKVNVSAAQSEGTGVKTDEDLKRTIAVHLRANRNVSETTARAIAEAFDIVMKVRLEEDRRSKKG
jgi:transcriptional regulator with XRE-family HTH domain